MSQPLDVVAAIREALVDRQPADTAPENPLATAMADTVKQPVGTADAVRQALADQADLRKRRDADQAVLKATTTAQIDGETAGIADQLAAAGKPVPVDLVAADKPRFKADLEAIKITKAFADAPLTARWFAAADNAAFARNDAEQLARLESLFAVPGMGAKLLEVPKGLIRAIPSTLGAGVKGAAEGSVVFDEKSYEDTARQITLMFSRTERMEKETGTQSAELRTTGANQLRGAARWYGEGPNADALNEAADLLESGGDPRVALQKLGAAKAMPAEKRDLYAVGEWLGNQLQDTLAPKRGLEDSLFTLFGEGLGSMAAFMATSALTGPVGSFALATATGVDEAYSRAKMAGLSSEEALEYSVYGAPAGFIQAISVEFLMRRLPIPAKRRFGAIVKDLFVTAGAESAVETLGALGQNAIQQQYDEKQGLWDGTLGQGLMAGSAAGTLRGLIFAFAPGARRSLFRDIERAERSGDIQKTFEALSQGVEGSALREAVPERFRDWASSVTTGTPAETVYVSAEGVQELAQAVNDPELLKQVVDALPGVTMEAFQTAVTNKTDLMIPMSTWMTDVIGTEIDAMLLPHVRLDPREMTSFERLANASTMAKEIAGLKQRIDALENGEGEPLTAEEAARVAVFDEVRGKIAQAGIAPSAVESYAAQYAAFFARQAQRGNVPIEEFLRRYPTADILIDGTEVSMRPVAANPRMTVGDLLTGIRDTGATSMPLINDARRQLTDMGIDLTVATDEEIVDALELRDTLRQVSEAAAPGSARLGRLLGSTALTSMPLNLTGVVDGGGPSIAARPTTVDGGPVGVELYQAEAAEGAKWAAGVEERRTTGVVDGGRTPTTLRFAGAPNLPIAMGASKLNTVRAKRVDTGMMPETILTNLRDLMIDPLAIIQQQGGTDDSDVLVFINARTNDGDYIAVAVKYNEPLRSRTGQVNKVNMIRTVMTVPADQMRRIAAGKGARAERVAYVRDGAAAATLALAIPSGRTASQGLLRYEQGVAYSGERKVATRDGIVNAGLTLYQMGQPVERLPGAEAASPGRVPGVRELASQYMRDAGLPVRHQAEYVKVDVSRARQIAQLYEDAKHEPENPEVRAAYDALAKETLAQYEALLSLGYTFEFIIGPDMYSSPADAIRDMRENRHLWVFPTESGFGSGITAEDRAVNPMLQDSGYIVDGRRALVNDIFRIVHDVFGHGSEGAAFGARGEENAWQAHVRMFSPLAARAMTTETRGQNSWVNYGPFGEDNRRDPKNTVYAEQKNTLLPEWVSAVGQDVDAVAETAIATGEVRGPQVVLKPGFFLRADRPQLPVRGDGKVELFHWSDSKHETINPRMAGSGPLLGPERRRGAKLSFFGINPRDNLREPGTGYVPEAGLGPMLHRVAVDPGRLYPWYEDPMGLKAKLTRENRQNVSAYEALIRDAGYLGYYVTEDGSGSAPLGNVAALFDAVDVEAVVDEDAGMVLYQSEEPSWYYSALTASVEKAKQAKASPKDWMAIMAAMPGVKKQEIQWTGVEEWLAGQPGQVTREELVRYLRSQEMEIVTTIGTEDGSSGDGEFEFRVTNQETREPEDDYISEEADEYYDDQLENLITARARRWSIRTAMEYPGFADTGLSEAAFEQQVQDAYEEVVAVRAKDSDETPDLTNPLHAWVNEQVDDDYIDSLKDDAREKAETLARDSYYANDPEVEYTFEVTFPDGSTEDIYATKSGYDGYYWDGNSYYSESELEQAVRDYYSERFETNEDDPGVKWGSYTENGGRNYREILLRVPNLPEMGPNAGRNVRDFVNSSHFEQPNIVVHARVKDRDTNSGGKMLFVEEVQGDLPSDWRKEIEELNEQAENSLYGDLIPQFSNLFTDELKALNAYGSHAKTKRVMEQPLKIALRVFEQGRTLIDMADMKGVAEGEMGQVGKYAAALREMLEDNKTAANRFLAAGKADQAWKTPIDAAEQLRIEVEAQQLEGEITAAYADVLEKTAEYFKHRDKIRKALMPSDQFVGDMYGVSAENTSLFTIALSRAKSMHRTGVAPSLSAGASFSDVMVYNIIVGMRERIAADPSLGEAILAENDARLEKEEATNKHEGLRNRRGSLLDRLSSPDLVGGSLVYTPFDGVIAYELMLKRLLNEAAANDYDALGWTPGYMQAQRWSGAVQNVVSAVTWKQATYYGGGENGRLSGALDDLATAHGLMYDLIVARPDASQLYNLNSQLGVAAEYIEGGSEYNGSLRDILEALQATNDATYLNWLIAIDAVRLAKSTAPQRTEVTLKGSNGDDVFFVDEMGIIIEKSGGRIPSEQVVGKSMSELIGRQMTDAILTSDGSGYAPANQIVIGGDGYKISYDQTMKKFVEKWAKRYNGKLGTRSNLPNFMDTGRARDAINRMTSAEHERLLGVALGEMAGQYIKRARSLAEQRMERARTDKLLYITRTANNAQAARARVVVEVERFTEVRASAGRRVDENETKLVEYINRKIAPLTTNHLMVRMGALGLPSRTAEDRARADVYATTVPTGELDLWYATRDALHELLMSDMLVLTNYLNVDPMGYAAMELEDFPGYANARAAISENEEMLNQLNGELVEFNENFEAKAQEVYEAELRKQVLDQVGQLMTTEKVLEEFPELNVGRPIWYIDITPEMRAAALEPQPLMQGKRGKIVLPPRGQVPTITLFSQANLSTLLHEMGHQYLYILQDLVKGENVDPGLLNDWQVINDWWLQNAEGVAEDANKAGGVVNADDVRTYLASTTTGDGAKDRAIAVGLQEQWARGFELYLLEGRTPSIGLRGAFSKFKAWMVAIYKRAEDLKVNVSPEMKDVFDRLFASEQELALAREDNRFGSLSAKDAAAMGVDEETWAKLLELQEEAAAEQEEAMLREIMAPLRRQQTAEYKAEREALAAVVRARVIAEPVHRLREWLGNGRWIDGTAPAELPLDMRIDRGQLVDTYGERILRLLPRGRYPIYSRQGEPGMMIDDVAGWFGFTSGDAMITALQQSGSIDAAVKAEVDQQMKAKYPDPMLSDAMEQVAIDALHGEKAGQLLVAEMRALAKGGNVKGKVTPRQQAREVARRTLAGTKIREAVRAYVWQAAERKAATEAAEKLATGDRQGAFDAKRRQLINHMLYSESRKVGELVMQVEGLVGRLKRKGTRQNLAPDYLEAIDDILATYEFTRVSNRKLDRRGALRRYVERMKEEGRENELAIPSAVLEQAEQVNYRELTTDELQGVFDALTNIVHTARMKKKLLDRQAQRELDDVVDEILANFDEFVPRKPRNRVATNASRRAKSVKQYLNLVLNAGTILRKIDGQQDAGAAYTHIKNRIDAAARDLTRRQEELVDKLAEVYGQYGRGEMRRMAVKKRYDFVDADLSKWDVISIALNMGNVDNLDRLTNKDARGFTRAQVDKLVETLEDRDWDFVQGMWDLINSYWPEIAAREKRLTGVAPKKVMAMPFTTPGGKNMAGGYYPIVYDGELSAQVTDEATADLMKNVMPGKFGKAQTSAGHLEARKNGSGGRPLMLGIEVAHMHLGRVIHDLAFSEAVSTSWRILQDKRLRGAFQDGGMLGDLETLELWLQDVATGQIGAQDIVSRLARRLKSNFTLAKLGFNISTVMVQLTGVAQSIVVVGAADYAIASAQYAKGMRGVTREIAAKSELMRHRQTTFNKDVFDIVGEVSKGPVEGGYNFLMRRYIGPVAFLLMQKVQYYGVDIPTWLAAYNKGIKAGMDEVAAVANADATLVRAQAGGEWADRSAFERGTLNRNSKQSDLVRLFTTLGSYMFAKLNIAYERTAKANRVVRAEGVSVKSTVEIAKLTVDMSLLFVIEAMLYAAIMGQLPDDEDDDDAGWAAFLLRETGLAVAAGLPFIRDLTGPLQGFSAGGAYGGISETITAPMLKALAAGEDGEIDRGLVKSIINGIGLATGLPSTATNRIVDGVWRDAEGEDVAPIEYLMGRKW